MSFQTLQSIVITLLVVGFLVYRQAKPRKLSERGLVLMPLILVYFIYSSWASFHPTTVKLGEIAVTAVISIVFGLLACRELKVYPSKETGKAMAVGSWTYFLWWLGAFMVKAALSVAFGEADFKNVSEVEILVPVLLLVITRNVYLYYRVNQLGLELHKHHD